MSAERLDGGALYFLRRRTDTPAPLRCIECGRTADAAWTALRAAGWHATADTLREYRCPACAGEDVLR